MVAFISLCMAGPASLKGTGVLFFQVPTDQISLCFFKWKVVNVLCLYDESFG